MEKGVDPKKIMKPTDEELARIKAVKAEKAKAAARVKAAAEKAAAEKAAAEKAAVKEAATKQAAAKEAAKQTVAKEAAAQEEQSAEAAKALQSPDESEVVIVKATTDGVRIREPLDKSVTESSCSEQSSDGECNSDLDAEKLVFSKMEELEEANLHYANVIDEMRRELSAIKAGNESATAFREVGQASGKGESLSDRATREHLNSIKNAIPMFTGTDTTGIEAAEFLRKAQTFLATTPLRPEHACLHLCARMSDVAGLWFEATREVEPGVETNPATFISEFKRNFVPADAKVVAAMDLLETKQRNRSAGEYGKDFIRKVSMVKGISEEMKVAVFVSNLKKEVRKQVQSSWENLKDLRTAMRAATRIDDTGREQDSHQVESALSTSFGKKKPRISQTEISKSSIVCYNCKKRGHKSFECRNPYKSVFGAKKRPRGSREEEEGRQVKHSRKEDAYYIDLGQGAERRSEKRRHGESDRQRSKSPDAGRQRGENINLRI